jgi:hypothetical protein
MSGLQEVPDISDFLGSARQSLPLRQLVASFQADCPSSQRIQGATMKIGPQPDKWLRKKAKQGMRGYPVGTIAFYG